LATANRTDVDIESADKSYNPSDSQPRPIISDDVAIAAETAEKVRHAMRWFPNPIALVTVSTAKPDSDPTKFDDCFGVIVSSFHSVTLGPPAIVCFNLRKPSRTLDALKKMRRFRVIIPNATKGGSILPRLFFNTSTPTPLTFYLD
jgi:flavin reductase (DIM6/NTAB) family NADH-FMN oxidoreductase RutF